MVMFMIMLDVPLLLLCRNIISSVYLYQSEMKDRLLISTG